MLPFGLKNAPAAFARFVFEVLGDLQKDGKPVAVFFDDIFIGGKTWKEHLELVDEVLKRLEEKNVVVKSSQAQFGMDSIDCLGFIVGADGVKPDLEKVGEIQAFAKPQTQEQLMGFLGLLNFYGPELAEDPEAFKQSDGRRSNCQSIGLVTEYGGGLRECEVTVLGAGIDYSARLSKPFTLTTDASEEGL